ncbi:unnamed protein product [Menidia menidia]|uniref:(Atlantic silverside) hypothetical protein n=1 Tax=Menidia menidia TaxID=238744 RepID=A0A8S4BMJ0_9TELE|nr:unnamed protein product [Menidia menidia]
MVSDGFSFFSSQSLSFFGLCGRKSTAEAGQKAWMTCGAGEERTIPALERLRPDLRPDVVFLYRDGRFENRVDLQDRQMKDGDVSLTLKDVTVKDTGTYQCRVSETQERNREMFKKPPSPSIWTVSASLAFVYRSSC